MVAIPDGAWVDNQTDGTEMRKALGALLAPGGPTTPRPGRLPGPGSPLTVSATAPASMAYLVKAGKAVTQRSATYGPVLGVGPDGDVTVPAPPAPASGSRYDLVYLLQRDPLPPANDASGGAVVDVASGAASSTPVRPSLPAGALLLGESLVPAGAATITSAMVTDKPVWTALRGSPIPVLSQAERDALKDAIGYPGLTVRRLDVAGLPTETYDGASWFRVGGDTGWQALNLSNGFTAADGLAVRRIGSEVWWRGSITRTAGNWPTSYETVGTLPSTFYQPTGFGRFFIPGFAGASANALVLQLNANTTVQIGGVGASSANAYLAGVCYLAD